ncbi:MAG: hypothetical protein A2052_07800 [Deltaproteobacteria bacterium GWA2_54_12]|nr:MAG: hypothetical protein A2052_07800 [Deltaproteobacteria bacterium GWA2_54_12]
MKHKARCSGHRPGSLFSLLVFLAFFASSVLLLPSISRSEDSVTIDSTGTAAIISNNASLARDEAIADALRKAVEQAVGTLVSADTLVENFQIIDDSVYTNSQGYVKNYSIISEAQSAGTYEVRVRAVVAVGDLSGDLGAMGLLQKKAERPRVLFMMAEKGLGQSDYDFWWKQNGPALEISAAEAALKEAFLSKGFNVVDMPGRGGVAGLEGPPGADLTGDGAASIGKALNAEIVVFGKAFVEQGPATGATSVGTYLADMTAQAVRVDDGAVLASSKGRGISRHISTITGNAEAVSRAAAIVAEGLTAQITGKWAGPQTIRITLKGMDYEKAVEFKKFLKTRVRGVEAIYQRRHAGAQTALEVEVKASAQAVADDIARLGKYRVTGFSSHVIEVEGAE